jgi:hypothetical protein
MKRGGNWGKYSRILLYICIKSYKKEKNAGRHSGGIIVYYKKIYIVHVCQRHFYLENGTLSMNRLCLTSVIKDFHGALTNQILCLLQSIFQSFRLITTKMI